MKNLSAIVFVAALIFFLARGAEESSGTNWRDLSRGENGGSVYYDPESVEQLDFDMVSVQVKYRNVYRYGGNNYSYSVSLLKIDCSSKKVTSVRIDDFETDGSLMSSVESPGEPWYPIFPGSLYGRLYEAVCSGGYPLRSEKR